MPGLVDLMPGLVGLIPGWSWDFGSASSCVLPVHLVYPSGLKVAESARKGRCEVAWSRSGICVVPLRSLWGGGCLCLCPAVVVVIHSVGLKSVAQLLPLLHSLQLRGPCCLPALLNAAGKWWKCLNVVDYAFPSASSLIVLAPTEIKMQCCVTLSSFNVKHLGGCVSSLVRLS